MTRTLAAVLLLLVALLLPTAAVAAQDGGDSFPAKCTVMNGQGQLPTCVQNSDGTWDAVYPSSGVGGAGFGGGIAALFVLGILVAIGVTVYKVSMARSMARSSGMDPDQATAMTLLDEDGLSATYLAANLRQQPAPAAPPLPAPSQPSSAARLTELRELLEGGLISQTEYDERRKAIIDSV